MTNNSFSNNTRMFEFSAVIPTVMGKFIFMDFLNWRLPFIIAAIIFWTGYVIYQRKRNPGITKHWGFRTDNFSKVTRSILPFGVVSIVIFIGVGLIKIQLMSRGILFQS